MSSVASVYARALFELKGSDSPLVSQSLREFWDSCQSHPTLRAVLSNPAVEAKKKRGIVSALADSLATVDQARRLLDLLAARGRLGCLPELIAELDRLIESSQGVIAGVVRSAVELSPEEISILSGALSKRTGGKVKLVQRVDPELLGGVVASVAGKTFDASLRTQMERFKNELI